MCLWPYRNYIFDDAPKLKDKKEEKKPDWYLVKPGDVLYPAGVSRTSSFFKCSLVISLSS